jgi:phosphopantetheinyl transferase
MMSADERARHERFMFAKDRHQILVTRGVLRTLLARYTAQCERFASGYSSCRTRTSNGVRPPGAALTWSSHRI